MIVGFIGAGHIAHALAEGWSRPRLAGPPSLFFFDVDAGRAAELAAACGGAAAADAGRAGRRRRPGARRRAARSTSRACCRHRRRCSGQRRSSPWRRASRSRGCWRRCPPAAASPASCPTWPRRSASAPSCSCPARSGRRVRPVEGLFALAGEVVELDEALFDAATSVAGCMPGMLGRLVDGRGRRRRGARPRRGRGRGGWPSPACTGRPPSSPARATLRPWSPPRLRRAA